MGILSNFIGGAAEAGGNILQRQRESDADLQKQQQYAKYNDDLARARELTTMELRKQYEQERDQYLSSPEYIARQTAAGRAKAEGEIATNLALAPKVAEVEAAEFEAGKGTRKAAQDEKTSFALDEYRQKTDAELAADIKKLSNPELQKARIKNIKDEAAARRDPTAAAADGVRLQIAQLELKSRQAESKIPPAVKAKVDMMRKEAETLGAAVVKANLDPAGANPEAVKKYEDRIASLYRDAGGLLDQYIDGGKAPKPTDASGLDADLAARIAALSAAKGKPAAGTEKAPGASTKEPSGPPVDRLRDQPIGILTPLATIKEAAAAGNKQAKAYLERRAQGQADTESAPRTAAEMLTRNP